MGFDNIWAVYWEALCVLSVIWQFQAVLGSHQENVFSPNTLKNISFKNKKSAGNIKVWTFWEAHIIWKNLPDGFDVYY